MKQPTDKFVNTEEKLGFTAVAPTQYQWTNWTSTSHFEGATELQRLLSEQLSRSLYKSVEELFIYNFNKYGQLEQLFRFIY